MYVQEACLYDHACTCHGDSIGIGIGRKRLVLQLAPILSLPLHICLMIQGFFPINYYIKERKQNQSPASDYISC